VPAVALQSERFAEVADFFSIGTNDLTQFTLAVDRGNDRVASLFRELHPAVLDLVARSVAAARARGIPVSVCGEIASDPRVTALLVGLGVDSLSMSPAYLSLVKQVLGTFTLAEAQALAEEVCAQPDAAHVDRLLAAFLTAHSGDLASALGVG
jgi:phosphotransferase system enzyme I (PtsI)